MLSFSIIVNYSIVSLAERCTEERIRVQRRTRTNDRARQTAYRGKIASEENVCARDTREDNITTPSRRFLSDSDFHPRLPAASTRAADRPQHRELHFALRKSILLSATAAGGDPQPRTPEKRTEGL